MHLFPGRYRVGDSVSIAIKIREEAWWFLEPAVNECCPEYGYLAHYGVTAIKGDGWRRVLAEWDELKARLSSATFTTDLPILRLVPKEERREFIKDLKRNSLRLIRLIEQLSSWVCAELGTHDEISILGI
jgi:hypothetical protein